MFNVFYNSKIWTNFLLDLFFEINYQHFKKNLGGLIALKRKGPINYEKLNNKGKGQRLWNWAELHTNCHATSCKLQGFGQVV